MDPQAAKGFRIEHLAGLKPWTQTKAPPFQTLEAAIRQAKHMAKTAQTMGAVIGYRVTNERGGTLWDSCQDSEV
jgi:hypothetical protein